MIPLAEFQKGVPEMVDQLKRLVQFESPTGDKAAVDRLGETLHEALAGLGAAVSVIEQPVTGNHRVARWQGASGAAPILLLFHIDTVHPVGSLARNPCVEREGRLYGPGSQDMKGGIVVFLAAIERILASGRPLPHPVTALFTTDEEIGSPTSRSLIESLARQSSLALCLEPALPDGSVKTWRKGTGEYTVVARGRATHAGADHENGRNAIEEIAHQVLAIQKMTDYTTGLTLNVGVIRGGTASNVVPDEAVIEVDFRVKDPGDALRIEAQMRALRPALGGTSLEISGGLGRPPMPRDERMVRAFQKAKAIGAQLGLDLTEGGTGGGSDANFVAPLGIPVLDGLGPLGSGQHSEREMVEIRSLPERAALLAGLLTEW